MAYGVPDDVAALARVWSDDGHWIDADEDYPQVRGTNPTLTTVTNWLDNLSAQMDIALGSSWFIVPVDPDDHPGAYKAISQYVCGLAADLAHLTNGVDREVSPQGKILQDMTKWVTINADGLIALGLTQTPSPSIKTQASFRVIGTL
jgi:hypothetical protein